MRHAYRIVSLVLATAVLAGCAPGSATGVPPDGGETTSPITDRTLKIIARGEPASLASKPLQSAGGVGAITGLFNADLAFADGQGVHHPYLAQALPELNTDTWQVFPDGRMQTIYRLKPNLTWHDGTRLSPEDFVFAWRVYATPAFGLAASVPINSIGSVTAPDPQSMLIQWTRSYPEAGVLTSGLPALPRHILDESFQRGDPEAFANHQYWSNQYVGLGAYKLERWEPGAFIDATAFSEHALGRPKIGRVQTTFTTNANAAIASLLTGDAHVVFDYVIMYEHAGALEKEWTARGMVGSVLYAPTLYRMTQIQFRPEFALPPILDVRVRQALAHAFDKQGINEALIGGKALITDSMTSPRAPYAQLVDAALTKYPFDTRRTQQLLEQAGLVRRADGFYASPGGERFRPDVWYIENPTQESENAILVDTLRRAGVDAHTEVLPVGLVRDGRVRASFGALSTTGGGGFESGLGTYAISAISSPQTRWQGSNRGAWSNAGYDRLWDAYNSTLNAAERIQQIVEMEQILSAEVVFIPHYFTPAITAHVGALRGPVLRTDPGGSWALNVHNWEWTA